MACFCQSLLRFELQVPGCKQLTERKHVDVDCGLSLWPGLAVTSQTLAVTVQRLSQIGRAHV